MDALLMVLVAAALLIISYFSYGRWLSFRVFTLREDATTPAVSLRDDRDFVPTKKSVVFGHHFTSIAGTGPIVGPAIAVMWGWLPAVLWVVFGAIFIGAVHDLGSLAVSLKNKGRTVGDIAGDLLGPRVRTLFLVILIVALWIVLAIFGLVIAAVLRQYPGAIFPVMVQVPLALAIGLFIHKKGRSIVLPSLVALALMYASVIWGDTGFLHTFNEVAAAQPTWLWVLALLGYAYVASVLPVWTLLQPRDYINALQLVTALALLVAGLVGAAFLGGEPLAPGAERVPLKLAAPVMNLHPAGAPPMIPVLFITIACGAISGFHCLVSSGTTSKQLKRETDAHAVGYGSMLTESFLATLVIAACAAGIGLGISFKPESVSVSDMEMDFGGGIALETLTPASENEYLGIGFEKYTYYRDEDYNKVDPPNIKREWSFWTVAKDAEYTGMRSEAAQPIEPITPIETNEASHGAEGSTPAGRVVATRRADTEHFEQITLTHRLAFHHNYSSWSAAGSLGAKVGAFVDGAANLIAAIGVPHTIALALMGVLVASFAGTTMDTACRLQRYVIQELARTFLPPSPPGRGAGGEGTRASTDRTTTDTAGRPHPNPLPEGEGTGPRPAVWRLPFRLLATTHGATAFAVLTAALLAFLPAPGQSWSLDTAGSGGMLLWPLFGATNQLLGGLAFIVIAAWLIAHKRPWWFIVPPGLLMLALPAWALTLQAFTGSANLDSWMASGQWTLVGVSVFMLGVEAWMVAELVIRLRSGRLSGPEDGPQNEKTADQGSEFSTGG